MNDRPHLRSRIYFGTLTHHRHGPVDHAFRYPAWSAAVDLDELPRLDRSVRGFAWNRPGILSIRDDDYLAGAGSIRDRLATLFRERGIADPDGRILLVTTPRFLGHAFNPVNFYFCDDPAGRHRCVVAEVNNTFGERHLYLLGVDGAADTGSADEITAGHAKEFHVSPFNDLRGRYEFRLARPGDRLRLGVMLHRDGALVLDAWLTGEALPFDAAAVRRIAARYPLSAALVLPRIHLQALRLWAGKRLPIRRKPIPRHPGTIAIAGPSWIERSCRAAVYRALAAIRRGSLEVRVPGEPARAFGVGNGSPPPRVDVHDQRFFRRVAFGGSVGFGESYVHGEWDSDNLPGLLRTLVDNIDEIGAKTRSFAPTRRWSHRIAHALRANTLTGSRRNIRAHYDLGNEFYRTFLDDQTLQYSCAIFADESGDDESALASAQIRKITRLIGLARPKPDSSLLEIGCGWGGFAIETARRTGCRVTGLTISRAQYDLARDRVRGAELENRVEILLRDYRETAGRFDRIVSIEMLEAVGHDRLPEFFAACDRLLAPGGRLVLQVITIPDQRYDDYRRRPDWIQRYIFPGGHLPSLGALAAAAARRSRFVIERVDPIGTHYARTLRTWRKRFAARAPEIDAMGFDQRFRRMWTYYLVYCEAAFAARWIDDLQIVLHRPGIDG